MNFLNQNSNGIGISSKNNFFLLLVLLLGGLAGNFFKFTLFLNVDFIFGTIFSMLALQFFGPTVALISGALIASSTYVLWNHPYVIIITIAEMFIVGQLVSKKRTGLLAADFIYWLFIGMPLVYLFYHIVMKVPLESTYIFMIKQCINGVINVVLARLLFAVFTIFTRTTQISYKDLIYNLLAIFVLFPALVILAVNGRNEFALTDAQVKATLNRDSQRLTSRLNQWVMNRQKTTTYLATLASKKSPAQMQEHLEQGKLSDSNFKRIGLHNKESTVVAHYLE